MSSIGNNIASDLLTLRLVRLTAKLKCGQLSGRPVLRRSRNLTRLYGALNGCRRWERQNGSRQQVPARALHYTEKLTVAKQLFDLWYDATVFCDVHNHALFRRKTVVSLCKLYR